MLVRYLQYFLIMWLILSTIWMISTDLRAMFTVSMYYCVTAVDVMLYDVRFVDDVFTLYLIESSTSAHRSIHKPITHFSNLIKMKSIFYAATATLLASLSTAKHEVTTAVATTRKHHTDIRSQRYYSQRPYSTGMHFGRIQTLYCSIRVHE